MSGTNDIYNYVGFSLARGAGVTTAPSDYLDGFGGAYLSNRTFYRIFGTSKAEAPRMIKMTSAKVTDGDVLIMPSDIVSDWSGVLWVSPRSGLDYGRDDVKRTLTIRNDGTKPRTVSIDLVDDAANRQDITLAYTWLHVRDEGAALTNAQWTACTDAHVATKTLAAGERGLERHLRQVRGGQSPGGAVRSGRTARVRHGGRHDLAHMGGEGRRRDADDVRRLGLVLGQAEAHLLDRPSLQCARHRPFREVREVLRLGRAAVAEVRRAHQLGVRHRAGDLQPRRLGACRRQHIAVWTERP